MHSTLSFKIQQLRMKNQTAMVSSIALIVFALFVSAILPSLLVRYVYAEQQLFEQPALLEYIPVASFLLGVGYFIYAVIANFMREKRAKYLEMEMEMMGDGADCCGNHDHGSSMNDVAAMAEAMTKAPVKKVAAKKRASAKKTSKK